jgi:hypothetical protein
MLTCELDVDKTLTWVVVLASGNEDFASRALRSRKALVVYGVRVSILALVQTARSRTTSSLTRSSHKAGHGASRFLHNQSSAHTLTMWTRRGELAKIMCFRSP